MLPPTDLDSLSHADLKSLVLKLLEEAAELRRTVAAQRDEIARLKGGPGRPNIKPSGMDKATEPRPPPPTGSEARQKGGKTSKLSIHEERTVTVAAPPQGSRFKGYTNFVVQDLVIRSHVVNFRRERWQKPDGDMMTAPLPAGISGHFGPELRRFVLAQYHQGQMTVPRLLAQLRAFGIVISKRQLVRHRPRLPADHSTSRRGIGRASAGVCPTDRRDPEYQCGRDPSAATLKSRRMGRAFSVRNCQPERFLGQGKNRRTALSIEPGPSRFATRCGADCRPEGHSSRCCPLYYERPQPDADGAGRQWRINGWNLVCGAPGQALRFRSV